MNYITKSQYKGKVNPQFRGEFNELPSETVPNETMTVQELLDRYRQGQRPDQKRFQYLDVEDISKINQFYKHPGALDYTDLEALSKMNAERIKELEDLQAKMKQEEDDIKLKQKEKTVEQPPKEPEE